MQNKPNPQNQEPTLTPYPKKNYAKTTAPQPQKNKPKTNPIPSSFVPRPSSRAFTLPPRPHKSTSCLPPPIKKPIPATSGFRNFAFCIFSLLASRFIGFEFSLPTLSPKSAQFSLSAFQLCAKTERNHHPFMQNKPNLQKPKPNLTLYPKKLYKDFLLPGNQKNKPNSNPIPAQTNPINPTSNPNQTHQPKQTQSTPHQTQIKPNPPTP